MVTDSEWLMSSIRRILEGLLKEHGDQIYDKHRLSYTYDDDDSPDGSGKPTRLYVCRCNEGFERRSFNFHIRDAYKGVLDA